MAEDADLELVKGIFRAWERGDFSSVDWAHPDISYDVPGPTDETRGIEGMSNHWAEWLRSYRGLRIEGRRYYQAGDKVVVDQVFHGEGRSSGIPLDQIAGAAVLTVGDGKVIRFRGYTNLPDARGRRIRPDDCPSLRFFFTHLPFSRPFLHSLAGGLVCGVVSRSRPCASSSSTVGPRTRMPRPRATR